MFELAWEGVGGGDDAVNNAGTAGIAARWRKLGYDASSRLAMASAAERTSARAGESAWRVYAECVQPGSSSGGTSRANSAPQSMRLWA